MNTQAILTALILAGATVANAQTGTTNWYLPQNVSDTAAAMPPYTQPYSGTYGAPYSRSSTLEEGALRGAGEYVRSWGDYNLNTAQANIYQEEANRRALENDRTATETFFQKRRINAEAVAAERGPRATPEALARYAREDAPKRLTNYQYEPALGRIFWPQALRSGEFAAARQALDVLAQAGELNVAHRDEIRQLVTGMTSRLQQQISKYEPGDYLAAKKFLASLEYESRFAGAPSNVASN